ncbi:cyclic nucleotide-binding domain-containing protein [Varunaivibrio sulfuroxidans]|uniref:Cyclic nucleotide-binding protein n=1 Tax=Varunaivibrio sulfuroxidans TaxID=1773489 RepID=A0A4R3JES2_9PROT|nr:cyclic nucleotide-binding domain-containing protein [Varunaivibrio sulfuroxidans]TCS64314.1 cyclic nucleotide-binding protein [Varunaivibrio sulfuroxidans]WES31250.1 cyclic nucleotide-binding domain-containing protein [Varunaivibrio sulfuroxidans]
MSNGDIVLERRNLAKGAQIYTQDEEAKNAYIIQQGGVEIIKNGKVSDTLGKGALFGEMALIGTAPRAASARTTEPTVLIVVTRQMFEEKLSKTDPFIRSIVNIFAETIQKLTADSP